jgi:DNA polymerase
MDEPEIIDQFEALLGWYRSTYHPAVLLEGELSHEAPLAQVAPPKSIPQIPIDSVQAIAQRSPQLQAFYEEIKECANCRLGALRKNFVFGYGNPNPKLMLIGEAPGYEEDLQGMPFVGPAGKLLTRILQAIGLSRDEVYIANMLKCRPPNNRDPFPDEVEQCEPYLQRQIDLLKPKLILALGRVAGQALLKKTDLLSVLRESVHRYHDIPLLVTYHPAALLRNPQWKEACWQDLKKVKKMLNSSA